MTTEEAMTIEEHVRTALEFLDEAYEQFEAWNIPNGSGKLWCASEQAITAVAKQRGWPYGEKGDEFEAVKRLAAEFNDPSLLTGFSFADQFRANSQIDFMENYSVEPCWSITSSFVLRLVGMARGTHERA